MTRPLLSCLCVTFGRTHHLQSALQCFLQQEYQEKELIILNTFPSQTLTGDFPQVKIINLKTRPPSLGACRNIVVKEAAGDLLITHDDDDLVLPWHLSNFAQHVASGVEWVWMENQFYAEKDQILKFMSGSYNTFAFTHRAWESVGGFNELSVGEDKNFVSRVTSALNGKRIALAPDKISFIYCWNNGTYHVSGLGEDKKGILPAYARAEQDLNRRVRVGSEKTGEIRLAPEPVDAKSLADDFLRQTTRKNEPQPLCIVELGRIGDIINLLPACRYIAEQYDRPHLMVSRQFASVLDGVSYVIPEPVDVPYDRLDAAMVIARKRFKFVLRAQIWAKRHTQDKQTTAYNVESWREIGFLQHFDDADFELLFDKRDTAREEKLVKKLKTDKPMLLVKVIGALSSPFQAGKAVLKAIQDNFSDKYNVIDLNVVQCERVYDLLGLMDVAAGLVTVDTSILHLAAASKIPVVAIVNPLPWAGSKPRCHCIATMTYTEAEKHPDALCGLLRAFTTPLDAKSPRLSVSTPPKRLIFHCCERHDDVGTETNRRKQAAQATWDSLYEGGAVIPCHYWQYARTAAQIGDRRALPYLKDVLKYAMDQAADDDIILFTNDDNTLHPELAESVQMCVSIYDAVCSQRCEFRRPPAPGSSPEQWVKSGQHHMGRDLFAFKKSWLTRNWGGIPDFILGASVWDLAMASLIRLDKGIRTSQANIQQHIFPAEMPRGYVGHLFHSPFWNSAQNAKSPSELWNKRLFQEWCSRNLPEVKFDQRGNF